MPETHTLEPNAKRQRNIASPSHSVSTAFSPSSTSSSGSGLSGDGETINWEALIHKHLPRIYLLNTGKEGKDYYQHCIEEIFANFLNQEMNGLCIQLFSTDRIGEVNLEESQQEQLLEFLVEVLKETAQENKHRRDLTILVHHRLPEKLAEALYHYATSQETGLSCLQWALICRQPFTEEMAAEINSISFTPPLHLAAFFDNPSLIARLKELGADINLKNQYGATACYVSALCGFPETTQQLINLGADPTLEQSGSGSTPLFAAASRVNEDIETVKVLLQAGVNINHATQGGFTPLFIATSLGHAKIVELLLQAEGIVINQESERKGTALYAAAIKGHIKIVELLLQARDIDVNKADIDGATPLYAAAAKGHTKIVELLLQARDIDVNKADIDDNTPLYAAARSQNIAIIKALMNHGANSMSALKYAVRSERSAVIDALFENGFYLSFHKIPRWLQPELFKRGENNITHRNNSLRGLALSSYVRTCDNLHHIPPHVRSVSQEFISRMPFGFTPIGQCIVSDALAGKPAALSYFEAYYAEAPQALKNWFKSAGKAFEIFNLALNLVTARVGGKRDFLHCFTPENRSALLSGSPVDLEFLYKEFPYESIIRWAKALIVAPEMVNFREPLLFLLNTLYAKRIVDLEEQGPILYANRESEARAPGYQFFNQAESRENMDSRSNDQLRYESERKLPG